MFLNVAHGIIHAMHRAKHSTQLRPECWIYNYSLGAEGQTTELHRCHKVKNRYMTRTQISADCKLVYLVYDMQPM
jgi:hypothetical protein